MKRVVYTQAMAKVARDTMQDVFPFESIDKDDANVVLAAVAPAIADKALRDFADYLEETGTAVGLEPATVKALGNITRRYADGLPKMQTAADRLVAQLELLHRRADNAEGWPPGAAALEEALDIARQMQEDEL